VGIIPKLESDEKERVMEERVNNEVETNVSGVSEGSMEDLGQALEDSYAYMGNGEYDTDTLLAWEKINEYKNTGKILNVTITGVVNKGVIALVEGIRGFIPVSRLDIEHVEDTNKWLGRDIRVRIIEANMETDKLVLSAREILREESAAAKKAQRDLAVSKIKEGSVVEGTVESIMPYGAFINLGDNVSGLVHISQISNEHIKSPREALEPGQKVTAKVIKNEDGKISLSIKELLEEKRLEEEEEIKNNIPEVESIGTSLASLLSGIKLDN
jgi:small subunit ribosomal protein S1